MNTRANVNRCYIISTLSNKFFFSFKKEKPLGGSTLYFDWKNDLSLFFNHMVKRVRPSYAVT